MVILHTRSSFIPWWLSFTHFQFSPIDGYPSHTFSFHPLVVIIHTLSAFIPWWLSFTYFQLYPLMVILHILSAFIPWWLSFTYFQLSPLDGYPSQYEMSNVLVQWQYSVGFVNGVWSFKHVSCKRYQTYRFSTKIKIGRHYILQCRMATGNKNKKGQAKGTEECGRHLHWQKWIGNIFSWTTCLICTDI